MSSMDFAFKLYRPLALDAPGENILFSPASVSSALAMLILGVPAASRAQLLEGEIQEGFQDLLLKPPVPDPQLLLAMGQHMLRASRDLAETQKCIHEYVEKQTQGKCGARAEELGTETAAVLVNHMLLRGKGTDAQSHQGLSTPRVTQAEKTALKLGLVSRVWTSIPKGCQKVIHKVEVTLNGQGSKAIAAISLPVTPRPHPNLDPAPPPGTKFNRPFLMRTFHMDTGSMLFLEKMVKPLGSCSPEALDGPGRTELGTTLESLL